MQKIEISDCLKRAVEQHFSRNGLVIDWRIVDEMQEHTVPKEYRRCLRITYSQWDEYLSRDDFISTSDTLKRKWTAACNSELLYEQPVTNGQKNAILNLAEIKQKVPAFREQRFNIALYNSHETDTRQTQTDRHTAGVVA